MRGTLRTDLFKTLPRLETKYIAIRDTLTKPDADIDILKMDTLHCRRGRLGVGYHFLVLLDGTVQLGRSIETYGSHSRKLDDCSVAIGVVGGVDQEGNRAYTRTSKQVAALNDLIALLSKLYPLATVDDKPDPNYSPLD